MRLLRRLLSAEQLADFDTNGYFYVLGSGGKNRYRIEFGGLTARIVERSVTHRLCVHTVTDESITYEEYYRAAGAEWRLLGQEDLRHQLMPQTVQVPACDEMLANKLLLENDELKFVETAIITHLAPPTADAEWFRPMGSWTQGRAPYPI